MGIREQNKSKTRQIIIDETKKVLLKKGYMKISTKDISERSKVSQGTIFLHFQNKNNLLNYILVQLINGYNEELQKSCDVGLKRSDFLHEVLSVISNHENVLSIIYRDYSHLHDDIKKSIDQTENTLKSLFFENIRNTKGKEISIVDSFILIDGLISQIKILLISKDPSSSSNIIRQSMGKLNKLHKHLLQ